MADMELVAGMLPRQKIFLAIVGVVNLLLWIVPSDVVELVARDRHTLLGRYSREHFSWILVSAIASILGLYIDWAPPEKRRQRGFQLAACSLFLVPSLLIVDFLIRSPEREHYVHTSIAYHRPPNEQFTVTYEDRPQAHRSFPIVQPGYDSVECAYQSDALGYRNAERREGYDVVAVGDSFTEGSLVSDGDPWPQQWAARSSLAIYNLGMSGYGPSEYLAAIREHALKLSPSRVVCMLYEGNDFRVTPVDLGRQARGLGNRFKRYVKQSPILESIDRLLIDHLGPIGSQRALPSLEVLDWLPVAVPEHDPKYYAFAPKQILDLYISTSKIRGSRVWEAFTGILTEMQEDCESAGAELIIVFAPAKAQVVLPAARNRLPAQKVRAFASLRSDDLPRADEFLAGLFVMMEAKRTLVADWCRDAGIPFVDTTGALRSAASAGKQVYYTYNQHWTREGHEVVADAIAQALSELDSPNASALAHSEP